MITALKDLVKRYWPAMRLRTILVIVLLAAAAMPTLEAVWLRGYENTLVRQTEAELMAQGAALAAAAEALWPGVIATAAGPAPSDPGYYRPEASTLDLSTTPVLAERPAAIPPPAGPDPEALAAAARVGPILDGASRVTLASIVMLDRRGQVVRGPEQGGDLSALPEVREALAGRVRTVLRRDGGYLSRHALEWLSRASGLRVHQARPIVVGGQVVGVLLLSRSPRTLFRGVYQDIWKLLLGALLIIGMLIALAGLVSRGVTRPIEALSAGTRAVAAGRGEVPETPQTAALEIRTLYADFRRMAEAIERRSRYLRDFAAAMSHEFKTPLAGIAGATELLQDHFQTMAPEDRARFLGNIEADTTRLTHLVGRLLDLARADMARPPADASADVEDLARRVANAFSGPGFAVTVVQAAALPDVAVPETMLEAVLTTLVENSRQAGAHAVTITARTDDGAVRVGIADDGPGVSPSDRDRLFEPFFTTRRETGGTGLGLAIARSLVEGHSGRLAVVPSAIGAAFELTLPAFMDAPARG